jgi:hypothetical protein
MRVIAFIEDQAVNDLLLYEIDPQELWGPDAL